MDCTDPYQSSEEARRFVSRFENQGTLKVFTDRFVRPINGETPYFKAKVSVVRLRYEISGGLCAQSGWKST